MDELRQFLLDANAAGYAANDAKKWIKEKDGSTTIAFEKGIWKSHDNFFGGEPYGGRIIVSLSQKPYWMMVYYGWVREGTDADIVYKVLRSALKNMPPTAPYRGPKELHQDEFDYFNNWSGDINRYSGEEKIYEGDTLIYKANYMGGLVDLKKGV